MSLADKIFIETCTDIIENGFSDENLAVRPKWLDGTPAHTVKKFCIVNRYDLRKEFPIITLRRTAFKSAVDEILWIWQKKSNNIKDLNSHIWDSWADETGSIGKAYGYQLGVKHKYNLLYICNINVCLFVFSLLVGTSSQTFHQLEEILQSQTFLHIFPLLYDKSLAPQVSRHFHLLLKQNVHIF